MENTLFIDKWLYILYIIMVCRINNLMFLILRHGDTQIIIKAIERIIL